MKNDLKKKKTISLRKHFQGNSVDEIVHKIGDNYMKQAASAMARQTDAMMLETPEQRRIRELEAELNESKDSLQELRQRNERLHKTIIAMLELI